MRCPNCGYEHGFNADQMKCVDGSSGDFFKLPIELKRKHVYGQDETSNVYGCPNCNVVFMNRW